jgi:hypothetical protein
MLQITIDAIRTVYIYIYIGTYSTSYVSTVYIQYYTVYANDC